MFYDRFMFSQIPDCEILPLLETLEKQKTWLEKKSFQFYLNLYKFVLLRSR